MMHDLYNILISGTFHLKIETLCLYVWNVLHCWALRARSEIVFPKHIPPPFSLSIPVYCHRRSLAVWCSGEAHSVTLVFEPLLPFLGPLACLVNWSLGACGGWIHCFNQQVLGHAGLPGTARSISHSVSSNRPIRARPARGVTHARLSLERARSFTNCLWLPHYARQPFASVDPFH